MPTITDSHIEPVNTMNPKRIAPPVSSVEAVKIAGAIPGWMDGGCLGWLYETATSLSAGAIAVELGSWLGRSTAAIALGMAKPPNLFCVDTWEGTKNEPVESFVVVGGEPRQLFSQYLLSCVGWLPVMIVGDSAESAALFGDESVSFLFIDADHSYEAVARDIAAWRPKMKKDGIMAGHDAWHAPIDRAIKEAFGQKTARVTSAIWRVLMREVSVG